MHSSTLYFFLGIAAGTLGALFAFITMMLTAWMLIDFIIMP
ncbi:hypothetical protein JCM19238_4151 [Vibrio ponticus]|nr:hypothetical protein JCM19238_4151 [Vibrio ponticus]